MIAGPSGVGKGSLIKMLQSSGLNYHLAISATTRNPRSGEVDGSDYFFMSETEFDELVAKGEFLEWAEFAGAKYGTLISEVNQRITAGQKVILEIEIAGMRQVKDKRTDALFIFIAPPSLDELATRLKSRATESPQEISRRLEIAKSELAAQDEFDLVLINQDLSETFGQLLNYCESKHKSET